MLNFVNFTLANMSWKDFPGRVVVGGWVRNTENKAQLRPAVAGALHELGKNNSMKGEIVVN